MKKIILLFSLIWQYHLSFAQIDSLDIQIGQMIMVGMSGHSVSANSPIITAIKKQHIGGVLLFELNLNPVQTEQKLSKLTNDLQDAASIPLLISIDQEGGKVNRLKTKYGFVDMPSAKFIGTKNDDMYTRETGVNTAQTLQRCGININFAPVLDVDNPACPVLGKLQRCYSADVEKIAHIASIIMDAHQEQGIKTVVKHFPGHGNSKTDSHKGLADVSKHWTNEELVPYKNLIAEGKIQALMTAHIINRNIDPSGLPATLSKKVVNNLLRNTMGYKGVVFSDDMQMHAISKYYGFEESIKKAINAGVDILIFSNNIANAKWYTAENIHATIKKLVLKNEIKAERIKESYDRIMALKHSR
ncbi:MAG: beta-N-acetylhexosaminidase [Bacteroidetes bacterium]|nr:beta-N-acetylhexosaminidase [Bacteroidota bacterium]